MDYCDHVTNKDYLDSINLRKIKKIDLHKLSIKQLSYLFLKNFDSTDSETENPIIEEHLSDILDIINIKKQQKTKITASIASRLEEILKLEKMVIESDGESTTFEKMFDGYVKDRNIPNYRQIQRQKNAHLRNVIVDEVVNNGVLKKMDRRAIKLKFFFDVPRKDRIKALDEVAKRDEYHASFLKKNAYASLSNAEIGRIIGRSGWRVALILKRAESKLKTAFLKKYGKPLIDRVLYS